MSGEPNPSPTARHVVTALVLDRPGTLNRVSSLLRARSFNIDSLTVGATNEPGLSRMTIVVRGDDAHTHQVIAQLERLVEVLEVIDLTHRPRLELELALVEVDPPAGADAEAALREAIALAGGELLSAGSDAWRLCLTDTPIQVERALEVLRGAGLRSLVRAGSVAMAVGATPPGGPLVTQLGETTS